MLLTSRRTASVLATCLLIGGLATATAAYGAARPPRGTARLHGSVAAAARPAAKVGRVMSTRPLKIQLWLRPNLAAAARYAYAVSTRGNASYHHYLSPAEYTRQFGASAAVAHEVRAWLVHQGFTGVRADAQRNYIVATGSVSRVQSAFHVTMNRYRARLANGHSTVFRSNDRALSMPAAIAKHVLAVTGLNNSQPHPLHTTLRRPAATGPAPAVCSHYWGEHTATTTPAFHGQSKFSTVSCGYSANQLRAGYGMNNANVGRGVRVALIEIGTPYKMFKTLTRYAQVSGLPAPQSTQYQEIAIGNGGACGNFFDVEEQLDSESLYAMAPSAGQLMIGGDSCDERFGGVQALFDAQQVVLNGNGRAPLARIMSNSWGLTGGETFPKSVQLAAHAILVRGAAEGVTMAFSSGDSPGVQVPASDPLALSVGGTTLGLDQHNGRIFETGWSNDDGVKVNGKWLDLGIGRDAAGGGRSLIWGEPAYQKGVVPAAMTHLGIGTNQADRSVPDISADADATTGILQIDTVSTRRGDRFVSFTDGGTSLAAPMIAGVLADAMQGRRKSFGFVNPAVYSLAGTTALHDPLPVTSSTPAANRAAYCPKAICGVPVVSLYDSQLADFTDQVTRRGYDNMTGVGTPNGQTFITAIRQATS